MHRGLFRFLHSLIGIFFLCGFYSYADNRTKSNCIPLTTESTIEIKIIPSVSKHGKEYNLLVKLVDDFRGKMRLNDDHITLHHLSATVKSDTTLTLFPIMNDGERSCRFIPGFPSVEENCSICIPAGFFEIEPLEYVEVDEIDIDRDKLSSLSVAGAWHKKGGRWNGTGMFSIIDDDSLDGEIKSSSQYGSYGYFSLLYPLLESLGLKGNLAVEGRRTGLCQTPPEPNDNLKTIVRLQNEKGWDILSHSMMCLGEILNNWMVDSLNSSLAKKILSIGPNNGADASTVSVYDKQTGRQYWPDSDNSGWIESPAIFIKPYVGDYKTKEEVMYNPDFDIDWHWGEWKRRAMQFGIDPKGFVTHNATSSHALVTGIMDYFPYGFSDLSVKNINTVPMLSSAVRAGLEGQSLKGYDGNNSDNTYNHRHYKEFCSQIDETAACGGWIMFNLHAYRDCWKNSLPGSLVSEGGSYPDEWVIPMKGTDPVNDPLSPPERLGISDWSEWYPCPGTRLHMLCDILKYAKKKGLVNVTSSQGFEIMGNKKASGYFNQGYVFGMDAKISGTRKIYPHYVVSATDEEFFYNTLISDEMAFGIESYLSPVDADGGFAKYGSFLIWEGADISEIKLKAFDFTGREILTSENNLIDLSGFIKGPYMVIAFNGRERVGAIKIFR